MRSVVPSLGLVPVVAGCGCDKVMLQTHAAWVARAKAFAGVRSWHCVRKRIMNPCHTMPTYDCSDRSSGVACKAGARQDVESLIAFGAFMTRCVGGASAQVYKAVLGGVQPVAVKEINCTGEKQMLAFRRYPFQARVRVPPLASRGPPPGLWSTITRR